MGDLDIEKILLEEPEATFTVAESSGFRWINMKYMGNSIIHGKLFMIFKSESSEPVMINLSYLSSITKNS